MKPVLLKNQRLQALLSDTINLFFNGRMKQLTTGVSPRHDDLIPAYHPCSNEYLYEAFKHDPRHYGFPRALHGIGSKDVGPRDWDLLKPIHDRISQIGMYLGTPNNALSMSYPDNGFIGWHHNGNAPGYNILLTYSQDGDGHFSYWDYNTKSVVRLQDEPGWQVRVGYYPRIDKERDRIFWHMAETKKQRITLAWVLNHRDMWENMIYELSNGDYDPDNLTV